MAIRSRSFIRRRVPAAFVGALVLALLCGDAGTAVADWDGGMSAFRKGDWTAALKEFQGVLADTPDYAGAHYMVGQCLQRLGRDAEALKELRAANRLDPASALYAVAAVHALLASGAPQDAARALAGVKEAQLDQKQRSALLVVRGEVALALGDDAAAVDFGQRATQAGPNAAEAWSFLGVAMSRTGRYRESFEAQRKAWDLSNDLEQGRLATEAGIHAAQLASGPAKLQLYEKASAVAAQLAEKSGKAKDELLAGEALMGAQQFDAALRAFDRSGPETALLAYYRGQCFQAKDDLKRAEALLRRALAMGPDERLRRDVYDALGYVLDRQRRYAEAERAYEDGGNAAKVAEMKKKQALESQNRAAEEEAKRLQELNRLQQEYRQLTGGQAPPAPSPTPTPHR
jgi:tetratricopeptide (TPR) repeat protein